MLKSFIVMQSMFKIQKLIFQFKVWENITEIVVHKVFEEIRDVLKLHKYCPVANTMLD